MMYDKSILICLWLIACMTVIDDCLAEPGNPDINDKITVIDRNAGGVNYKVEGYRQTSFGNQRDFYDGARKLSRSDDTINLFHNSTGVENTALGASALHNNIIGSFNTANGENALHENTTGFYNTANGAGALRNNKTGYFNTGNGAWVLINNSVGDNNTATGVWALADNTTGSFNTANGAWSLAENLSGFYNTAYGEKALQKNSTGSYNTAVGFHALNQNTLGTGNTALGARTFSKFSSGFSNMALGHFTGNNLVSGNWNIYIGNSEGGSFENATIRIGDVRHKSTYIAGIRDRKTAVANAVPVVIDSHGQLGTIDSSARFKKDIKDMADASHKLLQLRPVTYRYKEAGVNGDNPIEYGLIAEEVAKVYPDLVAYGADGQIETVQYHKLTPMLLNELQRMHINLQGAASKSVSLAAQLKTVQIKNQQLEKEVAGLKAQSVKVAALEQQVAGLQLQAKVIRELTARLSRIETGQIMAANH